MRVWIHCGGLRNSEKSFPFEVLSVGSTEGVIIFEQDFSVFITNEDCLCVSNSLRPMREWQRQFDPMVCMDCQMHFGLYRWHLTDPIRFQDDLRITIQALGWRRDGRYLPLQDDLVSVAYWYQILPG